MRRSAGARLQNWVFHSKPGPVRRLLGRLVGRIAAHRRKKQVTDSPTVTTVVVGALAMGGSGKTPVAALLARRYATFRQVGLVSRGYPQRHAQPVELTSSDEAWLGDEAAMLRSAVPSQVRVWVSSDLEAGRRAAAQSCDLVVVDDGFQTPSLSRSLNVVLYDPAGRADVLPAGPFREGIEALSAAHVIWCHGPQGLAADTDGLPERPIVQSEYQVAACRDDAGTDFGPKWLCGRRVQTLCGIARPESFYAMLRDAGATIVGGYEVKDHGVFKESVLRKMAEGGSPIVTTRKDRQRLPAWLKLYVVDVSILVSVDEGLRTIDELVGMGNAEAG